jgi:hypothetical protein
MVFGFLFAAPAAPADAPGDRDLERDDADDKSVKTVSSVPEDAEAHLIDKTLMNFAADCGLRDKWKRKKGTPKKLLSCLEEQEFVKGTWRL